MNILTILLVELSILQIQLDIQIVKLDILILLIMAQLVTIVPIHIMELMDYIQSLFLILKEQILDYILIFQLEWLIISLLIVQIIMLQENIG